MSVLRYLCLFVYIDVQHILCCVVCFVCLRLVSFVPYVAGFSGLSILDFTFAFSSVHLQGTLLGHIASFSLVHDVHGM